MTVRTKLFATLICSIATQSAAQSPFERFDGSKSMASIETEKELASKAVASCMRKYIDAQAKSSDKAINLWSAAEAHCPRECRQSNAAEADWWQYMIQQNPNYYGNTDYRRARNKLVADTRYGKSCSGSVSLTLDYAAAAKKKKKDEEIAAREPALLEAMKAKLLPALACNAKYSTLFAITTTETPENIATTSFSTCLQLFEDSAEVSIDPSYGPYWHGEFKTCRMETLRKTALQETTRIVVEERAKQHLAPTKPPDEAVKPKMPEAGI
jgi:hypothetical protein